MTSLWLGRIRTWWRALGRRPRCVVTCDDEKVVCRWPSGQVGSVAWSDLQRVEVVTNDQGPWLDDVFFVLEGTGDGCVVPHGSDGDSDLVEHLQRLPGFDNQALMAAMSSTGNATFLCWRRSVD